MRVGEIRGGYLDHRTAGNAYPAQIGRITSRAQALLEAREKIVAKSMRAGAEAADRILRQERDALEILTCKWDGCNERATIRCPWCHQVPYCSEDHQGFNVDGHGLECRARAMYR